MPANTTTVQLTTTGWTLLADGDLGFTQVLAQLETTGGALLHMAGSLPGAGVTDGIALVPQNNPFSGTLQLGTKLYGRARAAPATVTVMAVG